MGVQDWNAWERIVLVTDHKWMSDGLAMFAWAVPGQARAFSSSQHTAALHWLTKAQSTRALRATGFASQAVMWSWCGWTLRDIIRFMASEGSYLLASAETHVLNQGLTAAGHVAVPEYQYPGGTTTRPTGRRPCVGFGSGTGTSGCGPTNVSGPAHATVNARPA